MQYNKVLNDDTDKSGEYLMVVDNPPIKFTHEVYTITQNRISKCMTSNVDFAENAECKRRNKEVPMVVSSPK